MDHESGDRRPVSSLSLRSARRTFSAVCLAMLWMLIAVFTSSGVRTGGSSLLGDADQRKTRPAKGEGPRRIDGAHASGPD